MNIVAARIFVGMSALLFVTSAALTARLCAPMAAMAGMPMPGGWSMSMTWMAAPGGTLALATSFVGMWTVMMVAMMLPSIAPTLWHYRRAAAERDVVFAGWHAVAAGLGYFGVWIALGLTVFPLGLLLTRLQMQSAALSRAMPVAVGGVVLLAGLCQLTAWKARHLDCCRNSEPKHREMRTSHANPWRFGFRLGLHCVCRCAPMTAILLAAGIMDLRVMVVVTIAITLERIAPSGRLAARAIGVAAVIAGLSLMAQAAGIA